MSRDTSHELQGSTRSGDDITESTVLTMVIKVIIPAPDKVISWNLVTFLYDWPQQWAPYSYKPRVYVIYVRTQVRKTSTRNNVKNINHIHGHTKNQGHVWPSYFSKVSWQRKSWPLKGWDWQQRYDDFCTTIRVRIPKSVGGHNSIWIHKGILSAAYSVLQGFHIPLTRLEWLVWKNPNGYTDKMRKSKAEQSAQTRYTHRRNQVHGQSVRKSICPSALSGQSSDVNIWGITQL